MKRFVISMGMVILWTVIGQGRHVDGQDDHVDTQSHDKDSLVLSQFLASGRHGHHLVGNIKSYSQL